MTARPASRDGMAMPSREVGGFATRPPAASSQRQSGQLGIQVRDVSVVEIQHVIHRHFHSNGVQGGMAAVGVGLARAREMAGSDGIVAVIVGDGTLGEVLLRVL